MQRYVNYLNMYNSCARVVEKCPKCVCLQDMIVVYISCAVEHVFLFICHLPTIIGCCSTSAKIAALEAKLREMDSKSTSKDGIGERMLSTSYYNQSRVLRKHGGKLKIHRPQKPYNRTALVRKT